MAKILSIKEIAYRKYQMFWMMSHGLFVEDVFQVATDAFKEWNGEILDDPDECDSPDFSEYLEERGFGNGCIWACFKEFLETEYLDEYYMQSILTPSEYESYLEDVKSKEKIPYIEALHMVQNAVAEGFLRPWIDGRIPIYRETGWYLETQDDIARDLMWNKKSREEFTAAIEKKREELKEENKDPQAVSPVWISEVDKSQLYRKVLPGIYEFYRICPCNEDQDSYMIAHNVVNVNSFDLKPVATAFGYSSVETFQEQFDTELEKYAAEYIFNQFVRGGEVFLLTGEMSYEEAAKLITICATGEKI